MHNQQLPALSLTAVSLWNILVQWPLYHDDKPQLLDVPLVEFMYPVFTCMPGESYRRWLRSLLLCLCDVFQVLPSVLILDCWSQVFKKKGGWVDGQRNKPKSASNEWQFRQAVLSLKTMFFWTPLHFRPGGMTPLWCSYRCIYVVH